MPSSERRLPLFPPRPSFPSFAYTSESNRTVSRPLTPPVLISRPPSQRATQDFISPLPSPAPMKSQKDMTVKLNASTGPQNTSPERNGPQHPAGEVLLKSIFCLRSSNSRFTRLHEPIQTSSWNNPLSSSFQSLPNTTSQFISHEISDGGLATSTHRLAVNTGADISKGRSNIFGPRAKPLHLPKLNVFLSQLKPPAFSSWEEVLTPIEIDEYQMSNHRRFPIFHLIPRGLSLNDLKSNRRKREMLPGFENDCWRFFVEILVLGAGSPYGQYMNVDVFQFYTRAVLSLYSGGKPEVVKSGLVYTGGGSLALVVSFLLILLLTFKCRKSQNEVYSDPFRVCLQNTILIIAFDTLDLNTEAPFRSADNHVPPYHSVYSYIEVCNRCAVLVFPSLHERWTMLQYDSGWRD